MYQNASKSQENIFIQEFKNFFLCFNIFSFFLLSHAKKYGALIKTCLRIAKMLLCFSIFIIYCFSDLKVFEGWKAMRSLSRHVVFFGHLLNLVVCIVNADLTTNHESKIFELFEKIDTELQFGLLVAIDYMEQKKPLYKKFGASFILLLFILIATIAIDYYERKPLIVYIAIRLAAGLVFVRCFQLVFYIDLTKKRMDMIETRLNQFLMTENTKQSFKLLYKKIVAMKNIYRRIWQLTHHINKCFGLSLLVITTFFFIDLVCKLF